MVTFLPVTHRNDRREIRPGRLNRRDGGRHHGAEITLLRDLFLWQYDARPSRTLA
jgi:hypothetical protein